MSDLVDFLLARITDDELACRDADVLRSATGAAFPGLPRGMTTGEAERRVKRALTSVGVWDRARVLAECEAKRRVIDAYQHLAADPDPEVSMQAWTFALVVLVIPYADHPGCDQEWLALARQE